jgi:hypothetical protein
VGPVKIAAPVSVIVAGVPVRDPTTVCGLLSCDSTPAGELSTAEAVEVAVLSVPDVFVTESMMLSPAVTAKLPEIVQVVPPDAMLHVVPWMLWLISSLTVKAPAVAVGNVNVALVIAPVKGTFVTSQVPIVVLEQLVESEAYRTVVPHVALLIVPLEKFVIVGAPPVASCL